MVDSGIKQLFNLIGYLSYTVIVKTFRIITMASTNFKDVHDAVHGYFDTIALKNKIALMPYHAAFTSLGIELLCFINVDENCSEERKKRKSGRTSQMKSLLLQSIYM